jgi:signal transduction histidine kinase
LRHCCIDVEISREFESNSTSALIFIVANRQKEKITLIETRFLLYLGGAKSQYADGSDRLTSTERRLDNKIASAKRSMQKPGEDRPGERMTDAQTAADYWRRLVFDETTAALILTDRGGIIICANAAAQRMFGYEAHELAGRSLSELLPDAPEPGAFCSGLFAAHSDGARFPVLLRLTPPEADPHGRILATVIRLSEVSRGTAALVERAADLEEANERLARFALVASQDLQAPLRKIAVFGDLMQDAIARGDRDELTHANEVMRLAALRARALVHDLLSFSRIVNDELELAALNLREAIEASLAALAGPEEMDALIEIDLPPVTIEADATQFQRLVGNILTNAVKYRKPGGPARIAIRAFRDETQLCLAIADEGIGFEAQYAQNIFEPLKQLHSKVDYPGSGVGLAMCKAIADRHGWRLSVEARPGVGATFFIVLPLRADLPR